MRLIQKLMIAGFIVYCTLHNAGYTEQETPRQHLESAQGYANAGQWNYANHEWRAALAEDPESLDAHIGLAETLMQSGQVQEAVKHLQNARKTIHKLSLDLVYGRALERAKSYQYAGNLYMQILELAPMNAEAFQRLGELLPELQGTQQKSVAAYLNRRIADASIKGRVAVKDGNYPLAAENFAISTAYAPKSRDINDYAVSLILLGQYDEARNQLNRLQTLQPPDWQYYANRSLVSLGKGQPVAATGDIEEAIGLCAGSPQKSLLYNVLGFIYESQGKWLKARIAYQRSLELDPDLTKARMNLAYVYQKGDAYEEAIKTYENLLLRNPKNTSLWNRLGFAYELADKERQALEAYKKATMLAPEDPEAYYNLTLLYRKLDKTKEADLAYKSVMRIEFQQIEAGKKDRNLLKVAGTGRQSGSNERNPQHRLLEYVDVFFSNTDTSAAML